MAAPSPSAVGACLSVDDSPRRIWLRITPLLPRAPISEPWLMASHVGVEVALGRVVHLGDDGVERARHVGAGVAVGHRVDVEAVEAAGVGAHRVAERRDDVAQGTRIEPFQGGHEPTSYDGRAASLARPCSLAGW